MMVPQIVSPSVLSDNLSQLSDGQNRHSSSPKELSPWIRTTRVLTSPVRTYSKLPWQRNQPFNFSIAVEINH